MTAVDYYELNKEAEEGKWTMDNGRFPERGTLKTKLTPKGVTLNSEPGFKQ